MPGMFCCCACPALAATAQTTIGTTATPKRSARLDHVIDIILILSPGAASPEPLSTTAPARGRHLKSS
jgi:hypothetical protein